VSLVERVHGAYGHPRRVRVLARHFCALIPSGASLLDVGCGDGRLDRAILDERPDLRIHGVDVLARPDALIEVEPFDGRHLPQADGSVDGVLLVDVLHHSEDPKALLAEAARVARSSIFVKDHTLDGFLAGPTLRFMDDVGNARHGVALPYNYWPRRRWDEVLAELGLGVRSWNPRVGLYPWPASWVFGRGLHFVAELDASCGGAA